MQFQNIKVEQTHYEKNNRHQLFILKHVEKF